MNIGIDGYEANIEKRVGVGQYAYEILTHLYPLTRKHNVTVYMPSPPRNDMPAETTSWGYHVSGPARLWTFIGLPLAMKSENLDVMYSPTHYIPRFTRVPRVMAIMDVSYLKYPELFKAKDRYQLRQWTAYSVRRAAKIITISQSSKNDIIKAYRVPAESVVVAYPGFTMKQEEHIITPKNYILSVGTIQPRKNYIRLIEAFAIFLKENKQKFSDLKLVIIGKKGWMYESILSAPKKFGIEDHVMFLDFVSDSTLPSYYKHALCFALPSLYEGFGLPVLEAMAYGCPVVVSNVSSLPEIAGKAGIYVNPESAQDIAKGLLTAVRQRNLIQGKNRINIGLSQTKKFTWEAAAKKTLDVLEHI